MIEQSNVRQMRVAFQDGFDFLYDSSTDTWSIRGVPDKLYGSQWIGGLCFYLRWPS